MKRFMDIVGPVMDYIADRLWLCLLTAAALAVAACFLQMFGLILILIVAMMFGLYVRWSLQRDYLISAAMQKGEVQWENKSKRRA